MLPDLGVIYRTQFLGTQRECEYTAAIMAVRFVDNNKEFLSRQNIELLSDSAELVDQVNKVLPIDRKSKVYRDTVRMYLKMHKMSLAWVPRSENRAAQLTPNLPPLKLNLNLDFDFGQKGNDSALTQRDDRPKSNPPN
jgi:hypothetical protein